MVSIIYGPVQPIFAAVPNALDRMGFRRGAPAASVLINLGCGADLAIAAAETFAATLQPGTTSLVISVLGPYAAEDWAAAREAATLWAFTRWAALAWAARGVRVNVIGVGASVLAPDQPMESSGQGAAAVAAIPASADDVAATVRAMWEMRSMTGQLIRLGA